jgi:sigma-B regulation protein RsbU (phosphoserine phosphatase)
VNDRHPPSARATEQSQLATLFDLGRQITSVLDLDELLHQIPVLIARLIDFDAFAVYLLDRRRGELTIAYAVGYPEHEVRSRRIKVGEGLAGRAVERREVLLSGDLPREPHYVPIVPGMLSTAVVPLVSKGQPVGVLNILSREPGAFGDRDVPILSQFGAHVAVAIENARLFEREHRDAEVFETLGEIAREFSSILDVDELLTHIARLTRRLVDYRTFGILLLDEQAGELEMRLALKYDERVTVPKVRLGEGIVGHAALLKQPVCVPDVSRDPRYIKVVEDVRSELAVPLLVKDRCIGVLDLESPVLDAFDKWHVEVMLLLASHAAVALENARLYEAVRANEERLDREVRFAQRVQAALLPTALPKRLRGVDVAARFAPARELGGDFYDYLSAEPYTLVVAVGAVSGKGVPAALYSAFASELVRSRTYRRRYTSERTNPSAVLAAMNTILHERRLEEYYCTLCYASFDLRRRVVTLANSGLPYPLRATAGTTAQVELPGVPLGALGGTTYDEIAFPLHAGDLIVFCSDGVFEAEDPSGQEFGAERLIDVVSRARGGHAKSVVDAIFAAMEEFRRDAVQNDDMTAVAVRMTT